MPKTTPMVKVMQTKGHGATVVLHGEKFDDASAHSRQLEPERGLTFIHPFDEADIISRQGTVALEILQDAPEIDTLVIPIGGGEPFSRMSTAARALKHDMRPVGLQAQPSPLKFQHARGQGT